MTATMATPPPLPVMSARLLEGGVRSTSGPGGNSGDAIGSVQDDELGPHDHTHSNGPRANANGSLNPERRRRRDGLHRGA